MSTNLRIIFLSATIAIFFMPPLIPDLAAQEENELRLEEIIVTGRKRQESLIDAPYAITALTAQDIQIKGIAELDDVSAFTPGFFNTNFSVGRANREHRFLLFRGMHPRTELPHRAAASLFIDGAPSIGPEFGNAEDIERIEVLKGPQAAHFGRSTYSGAINVITKDPGDEFSARISADIADYGTSRVSASIDIPMGETFGARISASTYETDGMYDNAVVPGQQLGARSTDDYSLTLKFEPSDRFDAKLRYHAWEDNDGPDATTLFDHRMGSGGEHHNCTPGGTWERPASQQTLADLIPQGFGSDVTISPTWICGQIPIPTAAQIGQDTGSTRALALRSNVNDVELLPNSVLPDQFGLAREAQEMSLVANVNFENGVILSFTGAAHEDFYGTYNDFDQRASEGLYEQGLGGSMFGFFGQNHPADAQNARITNLEDSSLEFRLSSSQDKRFRWSVGYSDTQIDTERQSTGSLIITHAVDGIDNEFAQYPTSYNPYWVFGGDSTFSNALFNGTTNFGLGRLGINDGIDWADIHTTAIFGSMSFDFTDKLSASLEIRRQEDDVTEGNYLYTKSAVDPVDGSFSATIPDRPAGLSDTFKSTLPRFIVDYKPSDDATLYFSYAEGTRPGLFNTGLAGLSDAELAQVLPQNNGTGVSVGEEELESMEVGFKSYFLDGRGYLAVALYKMKIENLHTSTFALSYTDDDGAAQNITGSFVSDGASVDMGGVEVEGSVLLNENWSLGFTYAQNNSEFGNDFFSSQAFDLLGDATLAAGKPFSRSPVNSGSLSLDYKRNMNANWDLFARGDVIYTGKMYASQANITHTGDSTRINLRFGFSSDDTTVELYCLNCTDDDTPKSLQAMFDFSGISGGFSDVPAGIGGARALGVALADKPLVGIRASYAFGGDR